VNHRDPTLTVSRALTLFADVPQTMLSSSSVPHTIWSSSLEIVPQTMFSPREYSSKAFTALAVSAGGATNELRWLRFGVLS